jgi:hypothetical protein
MTVDLTRQRESEAVAGSLRALLSGVVDYAGLFPPAELDMQTTVRNYADHLAGDAAWMLGRLVVPAGRLDELEAHTQGLLPTQEDAEPWPLSAAVSPAGDPKLEADLQRIRAFNEAHASAAEGLATIRTIELRADAADAIEGALNRMPDELFPFFELPAEPDPRGMMAALAGSDAGAKVRTGGQTVPRPQELARFITACAAAGLPFKATAGLYHPLRRPSQAAGAEEFGFLNVLVAAVLADKAHLGEEELARVLVAESPDSLAFDDEALGWGGHRVATGAVEEARMKFAVSFGSCSFTEPLEDLRAMKLL